MSTDTKIKTLIFNKLTQEQYNNADRVPTEFYLTPDDTDEKLAAKQDKLIAGTNITIEGNVISAAGGSGTGEFDYVVETYTDEQGNWYRKYKSGWIEQGGVATSETVTLLKPMENANYSVYMSQAYKDGDYSAYSAQPHNRTTTSFSYFQYQGIFNAFWYVCGKGAN